MNCGATRRQNGGSEAVCYTRPGGAALLAAGAVLPGAEELGALAGRLREAKRMSQAGNEVVQVAWGGWPGAEDGCVVRLLGAGQRWPSATYFADSRDCRQGGTLKPSNSTLWLWKASMFYLLG